MIFQMLFINLRSSELEFTLTFCVFIFLIYIKKLQSKICNTTCGRTIKYIKFTDPTTRALQMLIQVLELSHITKKYKDGEDHFQLRQFRLHLRFSIILKLEKLARILLNNKRLLIDNSLLGMIETFSWKEKETNQRSCLW